MTSAARRLTMNASSKDERIHVLFPVPRGPSRKNEERGTCSERGYIDTKFTVKMVSMSTDAPLPPPAHQRAQLTHARVELLDRHARVLRRQQSPARGFEDGEELHVLEQLDVAAGEIVAGRGEEVLVADRL